MRSHAVLLLLLLTGCTTVNIAQPRALPGGREVFVTSGDIVQPYESMGLLQVTRKGVMLFGVADFAGTDLNAGLQDLLAHARRMGGDGVINVRWSQTQYTTLGRVFSIFILGLLPGEVTVRGEVVRLRRGEAEPVRVNTY